MISTTRLAISNIILDLRNEYNITLELPVLVEDILEFFKGNKSPALVKKKMEDPDVRSPYVSMVAREIGFTNSVLFWEDVSNAVYEESKKHFYISHPLKLKGNEYELD